MINGIFNSAIFNNQIFNVGDEIGPPTPGGIDPSEGKKRSKRHLPFKPTGLLDRPIKEGRKDVEDRVDESRQIHADIAARIAREFENDNRENEQKEIARMSAAEIDAEIGARLRKKLQDDDDMLNMALLVMASQG